MTDSSASQVTVTGQQIAAPAADMQTSSRSSPIESSGSEVAGFASSLPQQGGGESAGELSARSRSHSRPRMSRPNSGTPALRDGPAQVRGRTLEESAHAMRPALGVRPRPTVSRGPAAGDLRANRPRAGTEEPERGRASRGVNRQGPEAWNPEAGAPTYQGERGLYVLTAAQLRQHGLRFEGLRANVANVVRTARE